ncbi:hypothetical protein BpHYR1_000890 [Brachionus plicatilis]|uniref:Uncharacterized protein n=1 Tax=Brachionus plicatilis TaxID=10195 RepID=A0A3M7SF80_BRAPC|nr:hypothetical protein BpHYR1_000890 [Brachionus plicatilis]
MLKNTNLTIFLLLILSQNKFSEFIEKKNNDGISALNSKIIDSLINETILLIISIQSIAYQKLRNQ